MAELLLALGVRPSTLRAVGFVATIAAATAAMLLACRALAMLLDVSPVLAQAGVWLAWLAWLGFALPRYSVRRGDCSVPYRLAFVRDLLPGIGCNFALLLQPLARALMDGSTATPGPHLIAGGVLVLAGGGMILAGVHAIGIARMFFVYEHTQSESPVTRGIYRAIRHPLFLGGELGSLGLALCVGTTAALALAAVNLSVLPAYVLLEDRRCSKVFGDPYRRYRLATGAVIPRAWMP